jgi:bifunctional NMN adenylyltransferase/nudix hydrolase
MLPKYDLAVCIGRFQLFHNAQLALIRQGLALARRCLVVIGSAHQARSPKNPFTWQERRDMIRLALADEERPRVHFAPVRDYYDTSRWVAAVRAEVGAQAGPLGSVVLVGHRKDATSEYLAQFPGWPLHDAGRLGDIHAKQLRNALFAADNVQPALAAIASQVPPTTIDFLQAWTQLEHFGRLRADWRDTAAEIAKWEGSPYPPVFVTVDAVLRMAGHVLLIRRGRAPGRGLLALPGGFIEQRETVYQSAVRELQEETGLQLLPTSLQDALAGVRVFDHPDRSQRGRVVTHAHYFAFGDVERLPQVRGSDDAQDAMWVPITELAGMEDRFHDDHFHILDSFLGVLTAA